jgi:predicted transcriptional regulator
MFVKNILGSGDKSQKNVEPIEEVILPNQPTQANYKIETQFSEDAVLEDQDTLLSELEKLANEEASLKQERVTLFTFRDQLKQKIKDEMEQRKRNIDQLKTEVAFMKAECEGLVKVVNSSVKPVGP